MRSILILGAALSLTACTSPGASVVGISTPKDAAGLMLSNLPAGDVAACMSRALQVPATQEVDGYRLMTAGSYPVEYRVHSINDELGRFTTQVDQTGSRDHEPTVSGCALGLAAEKRPIGR
ncbi:hypothetical protein [Sphingomonas sp. Leaf257]|uniref:hypothetical protein n=1 Tax=Sphingomonas sp. Leaf257 TaxID=1736309 RepID=UPI0012E2EF16|nr:hypothetical protein [Sphingomonas sp. Leaf257]